MVVYRYADVLTLLSEAIVRKGNAVTSEALDLLNQVRVRAKLNPYTMGDVKGVDDFLQKVLDERGHELWFEGVRRSDLIRHGQFIQNARDRGCTTTKDEFVDKNYRHLTKTPASWLAGTLIKKRMKSVRNLLKKQVVTSVHLLDCGDLFIQFSNGMLLEVFVNYSCEDYEYYRLMDLKSDVHIVVSYTNGGLCIQDPDGVVFEQYEPIGFVK